MTIHGRVLNAFRHHRVLRRLYRRGHGERSHVLNAFRHHRVLRLARRQHGRPLVRVLNAFRHHRVLRGSSQSIQSCCRCRCSTPFGIIGCYARCPVLRHRAQQLCSTPFGIIGCYAAIVSLQGFKDLVLNAFRHHRVLRQIWPSYKIRSWWCSTPFGIIGCYA